MNQLVLTLFLFITGATLSLAGEFSYDAGDPNGPANWGGQCKDNKQSPINIVMKDAVYENLGSFNFVNFDETLPNVTVVAENNDHTIAYKFPYNQYFVSGGGLPGTYTTNNFHFHWGSDNAQGSEHQVDGGKFPAELHIVNLNTKYANKSEAVQYGDGFAVLGVFIEVGDENTAFNSFLNYVTNVTEPNTTYTGVIPSFRLMDLLPDNKTAFFRYSGSLTVPNCSEAVIWTLFNHTIKMSEAQLDKMREAKFNATAFMVDNFRPVQHLNGRKVKTSFSPADVHGGNPASTPHPHGGSKPTHSTAGLFVWMLFAAFFLS